MGLEAAPEPNEHLLTSKNIAVYSWDLAEKYGKFLGLNSRQTLGDDELAHYEGIVVKIFLEASNPNHIQLMQKEHDEEVAMKLRAGWSWGPVLDEEARKHPDLLPFNQLPDPVQAKAIFFRSTVLSFRRFWAGY